jgi:hypothetical protein
MLKGVVDVSLEHRILVASDCSETALRIFWLTYSTQVTYLWLLFMSFIRNSRSFFIRYRVDRDHKIQQVDYKRRYGV